MFDFNFIASGMGYFFILPVFLLKYTTQGYISFPKKISSLSDIYGSLSYI